MCGELTGEFEDEEMELYRAWRRTRDRDTGMFEFLCRNQERWGEKCAVTSLKWAHYLNQENSW